MKPMYLPNVENNPASQGAYADLIAAVKSAGQPVSQIWHLFAYKPAMTKHLERFTHDAISVCALFNFYNRWVSSNGVCQMPEEGIQASGKRIAQTGYLRTDAAVPANHS